MTAALLPSAFAELSDSVAYVQRKSPYEYSSSCPQCGGSVHPDGELPDRFIMLLAERARAGIPFGWCRVCGYRWWPGQVGNKAIDPKTIELLKAQIREADTARAVERQRKLTEFSTKELWDELHRRMGEEQRAWWRAAGVPDSWQDYLRLGYTPDKAYRRAEALLHSPAYTIPYFGYRFVFKTMQYRLCAPSDPADRYRFEAGLGTAYYMATPSFPIADQVVVCEGAKKAMAVKIYGEQTDAVSVLAVPSAGDWRGNGLLDVLKTCGRVWIVFDPDCWKTPPEAGANWQPQPVLFAKEIGKHARVVDCPVKADDAFVKHGMDASEWQAIKRQAVKL